MSRGIRKAWIVAVAFAVCAIGVDGLPAQVRRPLPKPRPAPEPPPSPLKMKIRFEDGNVTAELQSVPIQLALAELAARTGIVFEIGLHDTTTVTVSLYKETPAEAVMRIAGRNNAILYYDTGEDGSPKVTFARIIASVDRPAQPSLSYIGTGTISKRGDDVAETPEQALRVLKEGGSPEAKEKAIELLVTSKADAAPEALSAALADEAPEVRAAAVEGLASLGDRDMLEQIVKALRDKNPGVRQSALTAVALLGDSDNLKDVRPLVKDPDASVVAAAESAVRKLSARRP